MGGVSCGGACRRAEISDFCLPATAGVILRGDYSTRMQRLAATLPNEYSC